MWGSFVGSLKDFLEFLLAGQAGEEGRILRPGGLKGDLSMKRQQ